MTRDWSRERWRKQYVREPLQQRLWSVMARGLRELLNALAEEDGALVRGAADPADALVRALGPHEDERALVRAAVETLLDDGFLVIGDGAVWICDFVAAQTAGAQRAETSASAPVHAAPPTAAIAKTSTERVRQFRERARQRATGVSTDDVSVPSGVSSSVSETVSPVSETVSPSRGDLKPDPLQILSREKDKQRDLPPPPRERVSRNGLRVSGEAFRGNGGTEEDDETTVPQNLEQALAMSVAARAALVEQRPELAGALCPERWPEVVAVATAFAEATGLQQAGLGRYASDEGVRAVVKLFAAGFAQTGLEYVARMVPKQPWWTASGRRLGLSSLSLEVVRRNLPTADGRARVASPSVAKVIAELAKEMANGAA